MVCPEQIIRRNQKNSLFFSCDNYMPPAGMFTRKWIKGLPTVTIKPCVHPGYIWSFSPRETKHKAYQPSDQVICREASKAQCVPPWAGGRHPAAVEKEWDILSRCLGGQQPPCLSPSTMIKQEVQSEPSRSKYKNSTCTRAVLWPHKLRLPGRKPAVDLPLDSQHAGWGSAPSWPCF